MFGPNIEVADRLSLVSPDDTHAALVAAWLNDPEVMRPLDADWSATNRVTEESARTAFGKFERDSQIMWHILERGACIGAVWINEISSDRKTGFYGIMIGDKTRWGNGLGTLVQRAVNDWAFTDGGFTSLQVRIFVGNTRSEHVARKVGYVDSGTTDERHPTAWQGVLNREAWAARPDA